ncbi:MAG: EamA family transporter [Candidatus Obscuribacterales bacterium]|nr:EamA family transporter [Candidatus Obscuribacterales bacterium]
MTERLAVYLREMSKLAKSLTVSFKPPPAFLVLCSAVLFGASTPCAKFFADSMPPQLMAGILYLGFGLALALFSFFVRDGQSSGGFASTFARAKKSDYAWLASTVLFGGVLAPLCLMIGLRSTEATTASLLLNLEAVFTAMIAWFVFKENFDRRIMLGMIFIVLGGALLSFHNSCSWNFSSGALFILASCLCWAVDNNSTGNISQFKPVQIAAVKGLVAGSINLSLALINGVKPPSFAAIGAVSLIGLVGYGLSLVLFIRSLRLLGTARSSAYFSTAPFVGAVISIALFQEPVTTNLVLAALFMGVGVFLHLTEDHAHEHAHSEDEHEHLHSHNDGHHLHEHEEKTDLSRPHSHWHKHFALTHTHPHFPDTSHRHEH